ncbi:hypothetical protein [Ferruginibacter sp.]|nr:hypothetical protein [Ferruginibacter sp.]
MIQAIITGDVVHSTRMNIEYRNWLFKQIAGALKQWDKDFGMRSETFRGDSFQSLVKKPNDALKLALLQKTFIRSLNPSDLYEIGKKNTASRKRILFPTWIFDARIAIGIGNVDLLANSLAGSGGQAFQLSGQLLDKMKNKKQALGISTNDRFKEELETEFVLLDALISKTTALQCEVINLKLLGYTEIEIAKKLSIMQSAVNQRSNSGNWNAIESMLKRFEIIYQ